MLYTTTLVVEQSDHQLQNLGLDGEIRYYPIQFDVGDIQFHHAYDHETDDGVTQGTVIKFYKGTSIATLAPFEEIEKLRREHDSNKS